MKREKSDGTHNEEFKLALQLPRKKQKVTLQQIWDELQELKQLFSHVIKDFPQIKPENTKTDTSRSTYEDEEAEETIEPIEIDDSSELLKPLETDEPVEESAESNKLSKSTEHVSSGKPIGKSVESSIKPLVVSRKLVESVIEIKDPEEVKERKDCHLN